MPQSGDVSCWDEYVFEHFPGLFVEKATSPALKPKQSLGTHGHLGGSLGLQTVVGALDLLCSMCMLGGPQLP